MAYSGIRSDDLSVEQVFQAFYRVPDYQREYVWTVRDVERLLTDVHTAYDQGAPDYFIGTIVTNFDARKKIYELIDGQQRLTTIYIALAAIRDALAEYNIPLQTVGPMLFSQVLDEDGNETAKHKLELQYGDSQQLLEALVTEKPAGKLPSTQQSTRSNTNLLETYRASLAFIASTFGAQETLARKFYAYLTQRVKVIRVQTDSVDRALHIFETINARGQSLDAMDLLKNLLFRQTSARSYEELKQVWKALSDRLSSAKERPMVFIRHFILAHYADKAIRTDEIYTWLIDKSNPKRPNYEDAPVEFAEQLLKGVNAYTNYANGRLADGTPCEPLSNIMNVSRTARQHLVLLLAASHLDTSSVILLAEELEKLLFVFVLSGQTANRYEQTFVDWAVRIRNIQSRGQLANFIASEIQVKRIGLGDEFEGALRGLQSKRLPKYRLKFLLAKLANYLDSKAYGVTNMEPYLSPTTEIEHILPESFGEDGIEQFGSTEEAVEFLGRLGNLTLIEKSLNAVASNRAFHEKLPIYSKSRFLITRMIAPGAEVGKNTLINRALEGFRSYRTWSPEDILDREDRLIELSKTIWMSKSDSPKVERART